MKIKNDKSVEFLDMKKNKIGVSGFKKAINNFYAKKDDPCSAHNPNETFNECFVREHDNFCDGWASCTLQDYAPLLVDASIAAHCGAC